MQAKRQSLSAERGSALCAFHFYFTDEAVRVSHIIEDW